MFIGPMDLNVLLIPFEDGKFVSAEETAQTKMLSSTCVNYEPD